MSSATTRSGPGTTCTPSSATRTSRSSRADDARRLGQGHHARAARAAGGRQHVPEPGPGGQDGDDARPHQRRPGHPGHRRRLVRARAHGARHRLRVAASASGSTGWTRRSARCGALLDGGECRRRPGGRYRFDALSSLEPRPIQARLPIMIGGSGERKTLRTVAKYADMWNAMGSVEKLAPQGRGPARALRRGRPRPGRDRAHRRLQADHPRHRGGGAAGVGGADGPQPHADGRRRGRRHVLGRDAGADRREDDRPPRARLPTFLAEMAAPYDDETLERWIGEVKPMVERRLRDFRPHRAILGSPDVQVPVPPGGLQRARGPRARAARRAHQRARAGDPGPHRCRARRQDRCSSARACAIGSASSSSRSSCARPTRTRTPPSQRLPAPTRPAWPTS